MAKLSQTIEGEDPCIQVLRLLGMPVDDLIIRDAHIDMPMDSLVTVNMECVAQVGGTIIPTRFDRKTYTIEITEAQNEG